MVCTGIASKQSFRKQIISLLQKLLEEGEKGRKEKFPHSLFEAPINLNTGHMWCQKEKSQGNLTYKQI